MSKKSALFIAIFVSFLVVVAPLPPMQVSYATETSLTKEEIGQFIYLFILLGFISEDKVPALEALLESWGIAMPSSTAELQVGEAERVDDSEESDGERIFYTEHERYTQQEILDVISHFLTRPTDIWLASVFKSSTENGTVRLTIESGHTTPKVLILTSLEKVIWHLEGDFSRTETIIVASKDAGSHVAEAPSNTNVLQLFETEYDTHFARLFVNCSTQPDGSYYCDNRGGLERAQRVVERFVGNSEVLTGISVHYDADALSLPENAITAETWRFDQEQ